jgi:UDP-glucose 4-epimerase
MSLAESALKVLVTGGAGFIGSHLVDRLVNCGYSVKVLDNLSTGRLDNIRGHLLNGRVEFVEGDVRDASIVEDCVKDVDMAFHLAAITSVPFSVENPGITFDVNVRGTMNLLRFCSKVGVSKFVFVSSCAVYGEPIFLPVTEEHPTNPISPYAESKLAAEKFCLGFHERRLLPAVVLRLFNVYGLRQGASEYCGVITRFIDRSNRKLPLVVYGDGGQSRDFVNVHDVVEAIVRSIISRNAEGEVFNVGYGEPTSINELANVVLEATKSGLEVTYESAREGDIKNSYANISKASRLLGYKPEVDLGHGLRKLLVGEALYPSENL